MAMHYPADYNVFALVEIEAEYCKPKDASIVDYVSQKIGHDFIATAESDKTLYVMRDLEQMLGKEITWLTGKTFDAVIKHRGALPNLMMRFCTTDMKLQPIFDWWINNFDEKVIMNLGIRYDELERAYDMKTKKFKPEKPFKHIIGKHENGNNKWAETQWRHTKYPLIADKIMHHKVGDWAKTTNLDFPSDSNCVGCFWKPWQQIRKNWDDEPLKMRWFSEMEQFKRRTFKKEMTYEEAKKISFAVGLFLRYRFGLSSGFLHQLRIPINNPLGY